MPGHDESGVMTLLETCISMILQFMLLVSQKPQLLCDVSWKNMLVLHLYYALLNRIKMKMGGKKCKITMCDFFNDAIQVVHACFIWKYTKARQNRGWITDEENVLFIFDEI